MPWAACSLVAALLALVPARCRKDAPPDLDGDGTADRYVLDFTGGAHCCYKLTVELSSTGATHAFPFELDGGGPGPYRTFAIRDHDGDGLDDIYLEIQTYNGEADPIPRRWTRRYGIRRNTILLSFARGRVRARDWPAAP